MVAIDDWCRSCVVVELVVQAPITAWRLLLLFTIELCSTVAPQSWADADCPSECTQPVPHW